MKALLRFLSAVLLLACLSGCAWSPPADDEDDWDPNVESRYQKKQCAATIDEDFSGRHVLLILYPRFNKTAYAPLDFSEVSCVQALDLSTDLSHNAPQRMLCLVLPENSKQGVLDAIAVLEQRDDVYRAEPNRYFDIDAMFAAHKGLLLGDAQALSSKLQAEMKDVYVQTACKPHNDYVLERHLYDEVITADQIRFVFIGQFHGACAVFSIGGPFGYTQALRTDTVDGVPFYYSSGHGMDVYCNGAFYTVSEAFEANILTHADLVKLLHNYTIKSRLIGSPASQGW